MGLLTALLGPSADSGWVSRNPADDYWYGPRGQSSAAGVEVSEELAMTLASVFACVAKLSKTVATLPAGVFEKVGNDKRRVADHPLNRILQVEASPEVGAVGWREMAMAHLLLWGNWYAEELRDNSGEVRGLMPLLTQYLTPRRSRQGNLYYEYQLPGATRTDYSPSDLLHLMGLTLNSITGVSVVGFHRDTFGRGLAESRFAGAFYGNGAWAGGFIREPPGTPSLSPDRQRELVAQFNEKLRGASKAFGVGYLAEGREWVPMTGMPLKDAQFLEGRQFTRTEVCAIYDVPPSKIHDDTRSTFSNVEQKNIDWSTDSILPWCVRIEQALKRRYFPDGPEYVKHNLSALVRGDIAARYGAYAIGRQWGWLTTNDVRRSEDMDPLEGGDDRLLPVNMARIENGKVIPLTPAAPANGSLPNETSPTAEPPRIEPGTFAGLFLDAARAVVAKECLAVEKAFQRRAKEPTTTGMKRWLAEFYREHETYTAEKFSAPLAMAMELLGLGDHKTRLAGLATGYAADSESTLMAALDEPQSIPGLLESWRQSRAEFLAARVTECLKLIPLETEA